MEQARKISPAMQEEVFVFPLSFSQQRLWFLDQFEPGSSVYNIPSAIRLRGALDVSALERSFQEIVNRHEALRTTFSMVEGEASTIPTGRAGRSPSAYTVTFAAYRSVCSTTAET
jgi:hypothetical protein